MRYWPDSPDSRALLREYFSVTRRKRRAWALSNALALLRELRADPRALYKRAKPAVPRLPVALQATGVWEAFVQELAQRPDPPGVGLPPAPPAQPTAAQAGPAAELNAAFSAAEVCTGLQLLRNGRSAGSSGLPAEFLRYAYGKPSSPDAPAPHRLQPALAELYNSWFQAGAVPDAANVSLVTPIYKRGDAAQPSNYRPIAVGEPVTRLYAALLNVRLVAYTERAGLRAPSQAGFRPRLSTQHQLFCLQHLVDRATHLRQPLFCCFLDLKGAYDRVPRALLWQALQRLGVHGRMLGALQSLYSNAEYAINVGGRRGVGVRSTRGVKQGCPLSPTLFGLLLDGLHWALLAGAPGAGPQLACGRSVPDLGYADDFCLLATSPAHLQRLLDVAHGFLTSVGMELSVNKTCVMAFGVAAAAAAEGVVWSCGGVRLERVEQYKYLGVTFSAAAGIAAAFPALRGRLYASWERLRRHFGTLHDGLSVPLMRAMFQQCIPPAGNYACEVWGVRRVSGQATKTRAELAATLVQLWRRLLRIRKGVHEAIVLRELGVPSPQSLWLRSTCRFWNSLAQAPAGSLHRAVALSDCDDAVSRNVKNWAWALHEELLVLGYVLPVARHTMVPIDVHEVLKLHAVRELQCWEGLDECPRTCPSPRANLCKYFRWFAVPADARRNEFLHLPLGLSRVLRVIAFRLGCHKLPIVARQHDRVPRAARLCLHCGQEALGDELHMLFDCEATRVARAPYAHLFPPGCTMSQVMRHRDVMAVAQCILACEHVYKQPPGG